jgi:hypothetical protein
MTGIEPSAAMLAVARAKPGADRMTWAQGSFEKLDGLHTDLLLMTSHVAQFFLAEDEWLAMLQAARTTLDGGGHLVFDIRRLTDPPFAGWPTESNRRRHGTSDAGVVEWWFKLLGTAGKRVGYELHYSFVHSGEKLVSVNELAFRSQDEITETLSRTGFEIEAVYGDWNGNPASAEAPGDDLRRAGQPVG